ncbi:Na/Pi cotransporter family protein [Planctomycetales bacterium ZRK34]|nr:Na/Pi cotransporter family protein [Planctomycetales bacterium ZRK34]
MFTLLTIAGGVALILFGVRYLRKGLDRLFGSRLATGMQRLARSRVRAFFTGLGISVLAPSSTTMSVLAVQTVQAGHLTARQTLAILLGADIGLTVTVQLIALNLHEYAPILILIGVVLFQFTKRSRTRGIGQVILALGFMFLGVLTIKNAASLIEPSGDVTQLLDIASRYPFFMAVLAALAAIALQSSTATIALMIGLVAGGQIMLPMSICVAWVVGANIGIVITTLLIGWGHLESRRLALGNLMIKLAVGLIILAAASPVADLAAESAATVTRQIANMHTGFNILVALVGLPLVVRMSRLAELLSPAPPQTEKPAFGPRYINTRGPVDSIALALGQSRQEILHMSEIVRGMLADMWRALKANDERLVRDVAHRDDHVDLLDEELKRYLTRVIGSDTDNDEAAEQMLQLRYTADLETIGDIIDKNLCELAHKKIELGVVFSPEGWAELDDFFNKVLENLQIAETAFVTRDHQLADQLIRHKQRLHTYAQELRDRHFTRLNAGLAEAHETSAIHLDLLTHLKRINSAVSHIGFAVIHAERAPREPESTVPEG